MPNDALRALIDDPSKWLQGEAVSLPKGLLGAGQAVPRARDAVEMLKRLQGGLTKVPQSAKTLFGDPSQYFQFSPQNMQMMDRMFKEANPVFKRMQAQGLFGKGK